MRKFLRLSLAFVFTFVVLGSCSVLPGNAAQEVQPPPTISQETQSPPNPIKAPAEWGVWYEIDPNGLVEVINWTLNPERTYWSTANTGDNFLRAYGGIPKLAYGVQLRTAVWTNNFSCDSGLQIAIWTRTSPWIKYLRGCDLHTGWNYLEFQLNDPSFGRGQGTLEISADPGDTGATWALAYAYVDGYVKVLFPQIAIGARTR
jgi:hypothetical protein